MCLNLLDIEIKTAFEDLTVYKRVLPQANIVLPENLQSLHGKPFTGVINNRGCKGVLVVEEGELFFCTNMPSLEGKDAKNKFGYEYSWVFDLTVQYFEAEGFFPKVTNLFTPYWDMLVEIGKTYTSKLERYRSRVEKGLHSFVNEEDARGDGGGFVVKCTIPEGSEYYEGLFCVKHSIASNKLRYDEILNL